MIVALGGHAAPLLRWQRRSKGRIWYAAASNQHEWIGTEKGTNRIKCWVRNKYEGGFIRSARTLVALQIRLLEGKMFNK